MNIERDEMQGPEEFYNVIIKYKTNKKIVSDIKKYLNLENEKDFIPVTVETLRWIASEIASGRKILSANEDLTDIYEYPPMDKKGIDELRAKIYEQCQPLTEDDNTPGTEQIDDDWLKRNLESL